MPRLEETGKKESNGKSNLADVMVNGNVIPKGIPDGLWIKCKQCEQIIYNKQLEENYKICPQCGYYYRLSARERIAMLLEPNSFKEYDTEVMPVDPINFVGVQSYRDKLRETQTKSGVNEAIITGEGYIGPHRSVLCVLEFEFLGGSMGSVMGEKIVRAIERAIKRKVPVIAVSASGGARMQEGILSLMQMAKTVAAVAKLSRFKLPYLSILTDPTTGGVSASFAMIGDVNLAEPGALICFAGPRVIEQTIRQPLPPGFQRAEFLQEHGMIDLVVPRRELKSTIIKLLNYFQGILPL